ncbi:MAG TPA: hypothetical protein VFC56_05040 [Stellaceae bacterium]|nr:hypothetical protein [Stellaceae bacterium]
MTQSPYAERAITLTFQLGKGDFGGSGADTLTIAGLRVVVHVELVLLPGTGVGIIRVYGMTLNHMNALTQAGLVYAARKNYVAVQAGDAQSGMTTVFNGVIVEAYPDMREMPNTAFFIRASPSQVIQLKPVPPVSFSGATPVPTALTSILNGTGFTLENGGVNTILASPYFPGAAWSQILSCVRAANCFAHLDPVKKVLAIWPKDGSRSGGTPEIGPDTGMIGYPEFQARQIHVRARFDPAIRSSVGQKIKINSQLKAASGEFVVNYLTYDLASQMPDGPWDMTIEATPVTGGAPAK